MFECAVKVALNNCSQDSYIKLCCCIYLAFSASICFYSFSIMLVSHSNSLFCCASYISILLLWRCSAI